MAEAKSFEINGIDVFVKDEYARNQLDNIVNELKDLSGGLDLSSLTMTTEAVVEGTKLILTDGTTTKETTIPSATTEQVKSVVNELVADGTLSALTIEDYSIAKEKLAIWDIERINLFNKDDETKTPGTGGMINISNGTGFATWGDENRTLSGYIEVKPSTYYYLDRILLSKNPQICEFNSEKIPIIQTSATVHKTNSDGYKCYVIKTSETTKYIRFIYSTELESKIMITENSYTEEYKSYNETNLILNQEGEELRNKLNKDYKITEKNVNDNSIIPNMTNFVFSDDLNLIDAENSGIESNTDLTGTYFSNYFKVYNKETLYFSVPFIAIYYYDNNKNLLSVVWGEKNEYEVRTQKEITIECEGVYYARVIKQNFTDFVVTRYKGEQNEYHNFTTKWFDLNDDYKEYFIKNVLNAETFTESIKNIMLPLTQHTSGKSYVAFGDSLLQYTGGTGIVGEDTGFLTQANKYLNMNVQNKGYAGSTWTGSGVGDCKARINELVSAGIAYDVITLAWGTNQDENLGTIEDEASDTGTMCAVMKWAVQQIRTNFPNTGIGIIIPPPSISGGNENKASLMIECCKHSSMHVPYLDLFHESNMTTVILTGGVSGDQVHLSSYGRNRYASALKSFIEKICPLLNSYKIVKNFTNVTTTAQYNYLTEGDNYDITLTAETGYIIDNVTITMNDKDITSTVYNSENGKVSIENCNGDVVITASATETTTTE